MKNIISFFNIQFLKYYILGFFLIIFNYLILNLLLSINLHYLICSTIIFIIGLISRFTLMSKIVFKKKINKKNFINFIKITINVYLIYIILFYLMSDLLKIHPSHTFIIIVIFFSLINFTYLKREW